MDKVHIEGMEMPESCSECIKDNQGKRRCNILEVLSVGYDKGIRHSQCPLSLDTPITVDEVEEALESMKDGYEFYIGNVNNSLMVNMGKKGNKNLNTIKQALTDKDSEIRISNGALEKANDDVFQLQSKLDKYEDVIDEVDDTKAGTGDECRLKAYYKLKQLKGENKHLLQEANIRMKQAHFNQPTITSEDIVKELNDAYDVEFECENSSYQYVENDEYCLFFYDMKLPDFKYWKTDNEIVFSDNTHLPIAHKITTFFMQEATDNG